jgi:Zn-dependent protease/predicted transcriptional regulator
MNWAWRIGRYAGIDVYIHATFLLLVAWVYLNNQQSGGTFSSFLHSLLFVLTVFAIIVLHEFGHALAARRYGIRTRDITLLPIGGVARLERMPEEPWQELVVALAGPAVNVVIVILLTLILTPAALLGSLREYHLPGGEFLMRLLWVNVWLVIFNLIPAFPMDGGRVLRALLSMFTRDHVRATQIAARTGQALAFLFFVGGAVLGWNPFLIFIGIFVWFGASGELRMVQARAALSGLTIDRLMTTHFQTVAPRDSLASVVAQILAGFQHDFPVVEDGQVVGLLLREDLIAAMKQRGDETPAGEVMRHTFVTAHPSEPVEAAFARLRAGQPATVPVVYAGHLVGIVTAERVHEFMAIRGVPPAGVPPRLEPG